MLWIVAALLVALAVWELWVCEGAHLGRGFVVAMYDLAARRYDSIKDFDWDWERRFLGEPLARAIGALASPMILDVGAGTGRAGRALLPLLSGDALLASVEPSHRMQAIGTRLLPDPRSGWLRAWADSLPFGENAFDVVVSLEMLEFTPSPRPRRDDPCPSSRRLAPHHEPSGESGALDPGSDHPAPRIPHLTGRIGDGPGGDGGLAGRI